MKDTHLTFTCSELPIPGTIIHVEDTALKKDRKTFSLD